MNRTSEEWQNLVSNGPYVRTGALLLPNLKLAVQDINEQHKANRKLATRVAELEGENAGLEESSLRNLHTLNRVIKEHETALIKIAELEARNEELIRYSDVRVKLAETLQSGFALAMTRLANAPLGLRSFLLSLRPFKHSFGG